MAANHKVLLTGKNKDLITDFFKHLSDKLEMFTTTLVAEDLKNHLHHLRPELLVVCAAKEASEDISVLAEIRSELSETKTQLILIGPIDECARIDAALPFKSDLVIYPSKEKEVIFEKVLGLLHEMMAIQEQNKQHILVIDDDPIMLKLIKEHLHTHYNVATAVSGKIALKFLETKYTDLILLDYEMPEMDGPQVLSALRERKHTEDIPVVFLTGTKDMDKVKKALLLKPQGYLLKPIDKEKLLEMITSLIGEW